MLLFFLALCFQCSNHKEKRLRAMSCPISRLCWANRKLYWWSFARRGWPASSLLQFHWEISFFFLLGWNGKHFWPELWAIRKKIANNYKWRGGLFIEQRKCDWGVSPRRIIPPFVSARTSQFVQLTVFLYYVYIFYYAIVLHFRIIPPFVSVCPPRFVHRTAFWPKSSQSGNNQQSKCTKLRGFSSGQKLK